MDKEMEKMQSTEIFIIPAKADDADIAAKLTFMAYKDFSYEMLGCKNETEVLKYFKELWILKNNRFSYEYSYMVKVDEKLTGLMTCYSGKFCKKLVTPTAFHLIKIGKFNFLWHILTHINYFYHFVFTTEAMEDVFYIGTLAVLPEYRSYGIGSKMIGFMRTLAEKQGFNKCSLLVEGDNMNGLGFYEKNGFEKVMYSEKPHTYYRVVNIFIKKQMKI
jgi:ribosomal protein S18 acetylase RimI-like enzyme